MRKSERPAGEAAVGQTTVAVQKYLELLAGDAAPDEVVRALLSRSIERLDRLCRAQLRGGYPRLTKGPGGIETGDLLAAVVERLLRATREVRPSNVRQFFGLANRHIRWELNSIARSLDAERRAAALRHDVVQDAVTDSGVAPAVLRLLDAIEELPEVEREVFDLVRVQGLSHTEAAAIVGVATKTVQRRLHDALVFLSERVGDFEEPDGPTPDQPRPK